jgi:hypothetical protein
MINTGICGHEFPVRKVLFALALVPCLSATAMAADYITGAVQNQTRRQAAFGDEVVLLRLDQGMQEEARTRTDTSGAFTIKVQYPDRLHLVRIIHQGVNYDLRAPGGEALSIDVFDAAPRRESWGSDFGQQMAHSEFQGLAWSALSPTPKSAA